VIPVDDVGNINASDVVPSKKYNGTQGPSSFILVEIHVFLMVSLWTSQLFEKFW